MSQIPGNKYAEVADYSTQYSPDFVERWDALIDWEKERPARMVSLNGCSKGTR